MQRLKTKARPRLGGERRAKREALAAEFGHSHFTPVALRLHKRNKDCIVAKLVIARPLSQIVLAMPYRHKRVTEHISLPPRVLQFARAQGAISWIVRHDLLGLCYRLPLSAVERVGWLQASDGQPEWFVPIARFEQIPWQSWPFVEDEVDLTEPAPAVQQLTLAGLGGME